MAERLGERARYAEIPGNHFMTLLNGDNIRQLVMENLDFLLWKDGREKGALPDESGVRVFSR